MAAPLNHMVVLEMAEIDAPNPRLDEACLWFHAQHPCLVNGLVVLNGIHGADDRVNVPAPGKQFHGYRRAEGFFYGRIAGT